MSGTVLTKSSAETSLLTEGAAEANPVTDYELAPAYPNPFWSVATPRSAGNPETKIAFALPVAGKVALCIYTMTGQLVRALVDDEKNAGRHVTVWNGRDEHGRFVASGVYLYRLMVTSPAPRGAASATKRDNVVFAKTARMTMLK